VISIWGTMSSCSMTPRDCTMPSQPKQTGETLSCGRGVLSGVRHRSSEL
jgi:hypothetical protein